MRKMQTLLASGAAAAALTMGAAPAMAELSASAAVSNIYLFRGIDQGPGTGAVSGDLTYSVGGFYGSVWASSALAGASEEVDLILGWGGEFGGLGVDIGAISYYYPGLASADSGNDIVEAYLGLSFAGLELYYYDNVRGNAATAGALSDDGFSYTTLGYSVGQFSALLGYADGEEPSGASHDNDYIHLDLSYAFNDNLTFTVSKIVDVDDEINGNKTSKGVTTPDPKGLNFGVDDDTLFVVTYSIPLK